MQQNIHYIVRDFAQSIKNTVCALHALKDAKSSSLGGLRQVIDHKTESMHS